MAISLAPSFDETEEERKRKHPATLAEALARMAPAPEIAPPTPAPEAQPASLVQRLAPQPQPPQPDAEPVPALPPWADAPPEYFGQTAQPTVPVTTGGQGAGIPPAIEEWRNPNPEPMIDRNMPFHGGSAAPLVPKVGDYTISPSDRDNMPYTEQPQLDKGGFPLHLEDAWGQQIKNTRQPSQRQSVAPALPETTPPAKPPQRRLPFEGDYGVSTKYGEKGSIWRMGYHPGTDYATPMNTKAVATDDGVIERVGRDEHYGNYVWVRHAWGTAIYGHLNSANVQAGQKVKAGDALGRTGNTGKSTGPHLHYEVRVDGQIVDPDSVGGGHGHHEGDGHDHSGDAGGTEMTALSVRGAPVINEGAPPPVDLPPGGLMAPPSYPTADSAYTTPQPQPFDGPSLDLPDVSGVFNNPFVQGIGSAIGAGAEALGRVPIASVIPMPRFPQDPTFGDLGGAVMEGLQAAGELGVGIPRLGGAGALGIPGSGAPRTPQEMGATARAAVAQGIARRKPQDPLAFIQAAVESVREYQQQRPEAYPGERFISEALFDASNLLPGIGIGDDLLQAITPIVRRSVGAAGNVAQTALPSLERAGMQLAGIDPATGLRRSESLGANLGNAFEALMRRNNDEIDRVNRQVQTAFTQGNEDEAVRLLGQIEKLSERNDELKAIAQQSGDLQAEIAALESAAAELPGGDLINLIAKSGDFKGELPETLTIRQHRELTGRDPAPGNIKGGRVPFYVVLDQRAAELGMSEDELAASIQQVQQMRQRAESLKDELRQLDRQARGDLPKPQGDSSFFAGPTRATPMDAPTPAQQAAQRLAGTRPPEPVAPPSPRPEPELVPREPATTTTGQQGQQKRGFAASVQDDADTPVAVREALDADPGSYYDPISNRAAAQAATDLITSDPNAARSLVYNSDEAPDATTSAVGQMLVRQALETGDYDEAVRLTEALAERATKAGQFIQALSMFSRLGREGILRYAQKIVNDAQAAGVRGAKLTPQQAEKLVAKATLIEQLKKVDAEELAPLRAAVQAAEAERDSALLLAKQLREQLAKSRQTAQQARAKAKPKRADDFMREMQEFFGARTAQPGAIRGKTSPLEYFSPEEQADYRAWAESITAIADDAEREAARTAFFNDLNAEVAARKAAARSEAAKAMPVEDAEEELRRQASGEVQQARSEVRTQRRIEREATTAQRQASRAELDPVQRQAQADRLRAERQARQEARRVEAERLRREKAVREAAAAQAQREATAAAALGNQRQAAIKAAEEALERQKAANFDRALKALEKQKTATEERAARSLERQKAEAPAKEAAAAAKAEEARLEKLAKQIEYLTNANVRETTTRAKAVGQTTINKLMRQMKDAGIVLPPKQAEEVVRRAASGPGGREEMLLTAEMLRDVAELVPVSFWRKVATVQTMAQLLNIKTFGRNLLGNLLFAGFENLTRAVAAGIDMPIALATGKRSVTAPNVGAQLSGAKRGLREGYEEAVRGVNIQQLPSQFDLPTQQGRVFRDTPILGGLETGLNLTLRTPDRAFFQAAFDDSLLSGAWVQARNEGLTGAARGRRQMELVADPPADLVEAARADALFRTFQDENGVTALAAAIKKGFNAIGFGPVLNPKAPTMSLDRWSRQFGLGDLIIKYPRTPANLLVRAVDYSPFGVVHTVRALVNGARGVGKNNQKAFVESLARATVGTVGLTATGYVLAQNGLLTGRSSKDPDVRAQATLQGMGQYRFNKTGLVRWVASGFDPAAAKVQRGDEWLSYDWAQPMAVSLAMGAQLALPEKKTKKVGPQSDGGIWEQLMDHGEAAFDIMSVGTDTIAQQPMIEGVRRVFGAQDPIQAAANVLKDAPASFVPTLLNQLNQVFDNTMRDTYDPDAIKEALNGVLAKVPVLANSLPAQVDVWGNDRDRYHSDGNNLFNVFVNPSFMSQYFPQPEAEMLLALQQATGETSHFPRDLKPQITMTEGGKTTTYNLTPLQAQAYQREMGERTRTAFAALAASEQFRSGTDEEQIDLLSKVIVRVNAEAKDVIRQQAQEVGGSVTPLPPPEPKKASSQETLSSANAVEYARYEQLFKEYDAIPAKLLAGPEGRAYQAAIDAVNAAPPGSVARRLAEAQAPYRIYNMLVDRERRLMRLQNRELEQAGRRFKGWSPLR